MYAAVSVAILFLAFCVQEFIPRMGESASYGLLLLFPVWFLCTAVTLSYPATLGLAFVAGLLWDLRHAVDPGVGATGLPLPGVTTFGMSIFFFGVLGTLMHGVRASYLKRQMGFPILMTGLGVFLFRLMDYLYLNIKRGDFEFPQPVFHEMCATALISMALSPLIYFLLYWLSRVLDARFRHQQFMR